MNVLTVISRVFDDFGGCARELWFDNLTTCCCRARRQPGPVLNPRFPGFAREYGFIPRACPAEFLASAHVHRSGRRQRTGTLDSSSRQPAEHRETGQAPDERFQPEFLRPIPLLARDYRDSAEALVRKDLRLTFDGNRYCVPQRDVGHKLTVKADSATVATYDQSKEIVSYAHSWERAVSSAQNVSKELFGQRADRQRTAAQQRLIRLLGPTSEYYLRKLAETDRSLARQVRELLELVRDYGPASVAAALEKAYAAQAFGAASPTSFASGKRRATFSRRCV